MEISGPLLGTEGSKRKIQEMNAVAMQLLLDSNYPHLIPDFWISWLGLMGVVIEHYKKEHPVFYLEILGHFKGDPKNAELDIPMM